MKKDPNLLKDLLKWLNKDPLELVKKIKDFPEIGKIFRILLTSTEFEHQKIKIFKTFLIFDKFSQSSKAGSLEAYFWYFERFLDKNLFFEEIFKSSTLPIGLLKSSLAYSEI